VKKMALLALLGAAAGAAVALFAVDQAVCGGFTAGFCFQSGYGNGLRRKTAKFERNMEKSGGMKKPELHGENMIG
jgi:hypothetical protein